MGEIDWLEDRIRELTGREVLKRPEIVTDTSDPMRIIRGQVLRLGGNNFVIEGNQYETRFGIGDQPKYWVFNAIDLSDGTKKIIKTVFNEEFNVHIGVFKIRCFRSPQKEAEVLSLVHGDDRFMQGYTVLDDTGNHVRIIDFIRGMTIFNYIYSIDKTHEQYFHDELPLILYRLTSSFEAIERLHQNHFCHGDIRNDHIIIERNSGKYRWIDFDLQQYVSDFDVWSLGNILNYAVGKGITSFQLVRRSKKFPPQVISSLTADDASAFYEYRIMNLKKLYPYIPERLNNILLNFTTRPRRSYENIRQLIEEYHEMLAVEFPSPDKGEGS